MAIKSKKSTSSVLESQNDQITVIEPGSITPENVNTAIIQENTNLVKDFRSHAIVNRDNSSYIAAVTSKHYHRSQRDNLQFLNDKIDKLEKLIAQLMPSNIE